MSLLPRLSAAFALVPLLVLTMLTPCAALADPAMIYLVRHGEKETVGKDPALTAEGLQRARNIAAMLGKAGIRHVFATPTARARQTAQPLAERSGLQVELYDPRSPQALVAKVKGLSGPVLVVGHSNTLPELVRLFGGTPGADIDDNEYDRLYQLIVSPNDGVTTILLTSPPVTPASNA
jgi:broad specificity phosphatase PhoE